MLYSYEKLDLARLRKTKVGSYRIEVSELVTAQSGTHKWLRKGILIGILLGALSLSYYYFQNPLSIMGPNHKTGLPAPHVKVEPSATPSPLPNDHPVLAQPVTTDSLATTAMPTLEKSMQEHSKLNAVTPEKVKINSHDSQSSFSVPNLLPTDNEHQRLMTATKTTVTTIEEPLLKHKPTKWSTSPLPTPSSLPDVPKPSEHNELTQLLQQCETHFQANRLTTGRGGTAFDCYQQILAQAPNHTEAQLGLHKIANRYQTWIMSALEQKQYPKALRYVNKIQQVNPQSDILAQIDTRLEQQVAAALTAKQFTQARRYLEQWAKLNPNSLSLPSLKQRLAKTIAHLLQQCNQHFQANRLTTGQLGTAFECYQQVLTQEPNNAIAQAGLKKIAARYQAWAESALKYQKWSNARHYLQRLQMVNPQSVALSQLQQRLNQLEQQSTSLKQSVAPPQRLLTSRSSSSELSNKPQSIISSSQSSPRLPSPTQPKPCSDILAQESLGIRPLTRDQKKFQQQYCNN